MILIVRTLDGTPTRINMLEEPDYKEKYLPLESDVWVQELPKPEIKTAKKKTTKKKTTKKKATKK